MMMTEEDWQHAITMLDNLDIFSSRYAKCSCCAYTNCCDEHVKCVDGIAKFMAFWDKQEAKNNDK